MLSLKQSCKIGAEIVAEQCYLHAQKMNIIRAKFQNLTKKAKCFTNHKTVSPETLNQLLQFMPVFCHKIIYPENNI